jgi:hypothetical protein
MSYRPITDVWILARCKYKGGIKRYGGYPGGFLERARVLIGCSREDAVLHVCGGMVKYYPYDGGFGPNDKTLDLDPKCEPDFLMDALDGVPQNPSLARPWAGILIDPPYTDEDAREYKPGIFPSANLLLRKSLFAVAVGTKVGILHYIIPQPPPTAKFLAMAAVMVGYNNRIRAFSVFERRQ